MNSLAQAKEVLASSQSVAVLTGAGVSAESGLATFRAVDGLWEGHRVEDVATPEAFARNPGLVWEFYEMRRIQAAEASPNPAHVSIANLQRRYEDFTLITQNVDGLHQRAGSTGVLEVHGSLWIIECRRCGTSREDRQVPQPSLPPKCSSCGAVERPAIVWFGEGLPEDVYLRGVEAVERSAVFVVVGTSAQVYPVAGLIPLARRNGSFIIEVNPEASALSHMAHVELRGKAGEVLPQLVAP